MYHKRPLNFIRGKKMFGPIQSSGWLLLNLVLQLSRHSYLHFSMLDQCEVLFRRKLQFKVYLILYFHNMDMVLQYANIFIKETLHYFLHSPFCRVEGLCQHATFKVRTEGTSNGPIRVKQVNRSSSMIG